MRQIVIAVLVLITGTAFSSAPAEAGSVSTVRFPPFALSPGERIMGVKLAAPESRISAGCRPNRWTCDQADGSIHCYSPHPTYATGISGMLPEFIVRSSGSGRPDLKATVEFIDNDGKEYSREIRADELIVK